MGHVEQIQHLRLRFEDFAAGRITGQRPHGVVVDVAESPAVALEQEWLIATGVLNAEQSRLIEYVDARLDGIFIDAEVGAGVDTILRSRKLLQVSRCQGGSSKARARFGGARPPAR